ncbi:hypothetical protein [Legionella bononiensis]|uniref:Coiled-coil protein n=1 Tax=Legionella bononiensis TaxID=2793102 RepID=A0ABS1WE08_9GAMM|nr:hypothetical protein [Legionella bononiensis]MBL7479571.1 hypothetical protein [Legionella bononiensis]MBL7527554.1 hypothetical protein [Legionella bononiensis]
MEDIELNTGIKFLKDHIKINYSDLKISEGLIKNGNVVILFTNRHEPLMLNIDKFGDAIRQLSWTNHDLKKHLKKDRKEISEDRGSLIQEIENQLGAD